MAAFEFTQADITAYLRGRQWLAQNGHIEKYHAVLCDPPYGLEFMGAEWDKPKPSSAYIRDPKGGRGTDGWGRAKLSRPDAYHAGYDFQTWVTEWASLMIDFVHPGAVGMFFGGTRTFHRLACGLEDAGWEVIDCIMYLYGSGFPKSHDISKAIDRAQGAEREVIGKKMDIKTGLPMSAKQAQSGVGKGLHEGYDRPWKHDEDHAERMTNITAPATDAAKQWDGYGTALKPMYEPVIIARAPRHPYTFAQLAQTFGSGALNVDGGRILHDEPLKLTERTAPRYAGVMNGGVIGGEKSTVASADPLGRFPGNVALVHTADCTAGKCAAGCPVAALDAMSGDVGAHGGDGEFIQHKWMDGRTTNQAIEKDDIGGASRFFYTSKASSFEREAGLPKRSKHPTLKPIQLIEWLSTLLLPPKLDTPRRLFVPFSGVASEMIGAHLAGWDVVHGIEQSGVYIDEGKQRAAWWGKFDSYDKAAESYASATVGKREDATLEAAGQLPLFSDEPAA